MHSASITGLKSSLACSCCASELALFVVVAGACVAGACVAGVSGHCRQVFVVVAGACVAGVSGHCRLGCCSPRSVKFELLVSVY